MSRWLVTLWSGARSRRTSAANSCALGATAGSLPAVGAADSACVPANCRRHARRLSVVMPKPWATRLAGTPLCHWATAACLNASSYGRWLTPVLFLPSSLLRVFFCLHPEPLSTLSGQSQPAGLVA